MNLGPSTWRRIASSIVVFAFGTAILVAPPRHSPSEAASVWPSYTVTDLGTLPGGHGAGPVDLNNSGEVVGTASDAEFNNHAFFWRDGVMTDLNPFLPPESQVSARATAINDLGNITIDSRADPPTENCKGLCAYLYDDGQVTSLGSLYRSHGINDAKEVAGSTTGDFCLRAGLWQGGQVTDLGTMGGCISDAMDINDSGAVAGYAELDTPLRQANASLWKDGTTQNLGTLGGCGSVGLALNNLGQVVGSAPVSGCDFAHAFLWRPGGMLDLGTLPGATTSKTNDINTWGQVVGNAGVPFYGDRPFLYDDGSMVDLNELIPADSGWELWRAAAINDSGQIVGGGSHDGHAAGFLLTPASPMGVDTNITAGPVGRVTPTTSSFEFVSNEPASFSCSLDGEPYSDCSSPAGYADLAQGRHGLEIRATDGAGAMEETPAPAEWIVASIRFTKIRFDPPGKDVRTNRKLNQEWVRIRNFASTPVSLDNWILRSANRRATYYFEGFSLAPGAAVKVHTGRGLDTATDVYWGRARYVWGNQSDGAILKRQNRTLADICRYSRLGDLGYISAKYCAPVDPSLYS